MIDDKEISGPLRNLSDPGELVGWTVSNRYKLTRHLGSGGFSDVFEAVNIKLPEQKVVIKFLKHLDSRDAFVQEARLMCGFDHPNICRIIDFLEKEHALVMQHIDGQDCHDLFKSNPSLFDENLILKIAQSVSSALAYLHSRSVAHRDIKPKNIMAGKNGQIYLIDFGIAKYVTDLATRTRHLSLTPEFAAPERRRLDNNYNPFISDIYEFGLTIDWLLTSSADWLKATENKKPVPDRRFKRILRKTTQLLPEKRYRTAAMVAEDLQTIQQIYKGKNYMKVNLAVLAAAAVIIFGTLLAEPKRFIDDFLKSDNITRTENKLEDILTTEPIRVSDSVQKKDAPRQSSDSFFSDSSLESILGEYRSSKVDNDKADIAVTSVPLDNLPPEPDFEPVFSWKNPLPIDAGCSVLEGCTTLTVRGFAPATMEKTSGYQTARRQAYYDALARGAGVYLQQTVSVNNHRDVASLMFSNSRGFISGWEEVEQDISEDGRYIVGIKASVCPGEIPDRMQQQALNILNQVILNSPRVKICLVDQKRYPELKFDIVSSFSNVLLEAGYRIYETTASKDEENFFARAFSLKEGLLNSSAPPVIDCDLLVGLKLDIQKSRSGEHEFTRGMKAVDIAASFRVIQTHTNRILAANSYTTTGLGNTAESALYNAVAKVSEIAAGDFITRVPEALTKHPRTISIDCRDCSDIALDNLLEAIKSVPDVYTARTVSWQSEPRSGLIEVQMDPIIGNPDLLWNYLKPQIGYKFILKNRDDKTLTLTAQFNNSIINQGG